MSMSTAIYSDLRRTGRIVSAAACFAGFVLWGRVTTASAAEIVSVTGSGVTEDVELRGTSSDENYGARGVADFRSANYIVLMRFDITDVTAIVGDDPDSIESATLRLHNTRDEADIDVRAYMMTRGWVEGEFNADDPDTSAEQYGATWNSPTGTGGAEGANTDSWGTLPGTSGGPDVELSSTAVEGAGWFEWDVTDAVRAWVEGTSSNHGFALTYRGGGGPTTPESSPVRAHRRPSCLSLWW